MSPRNRGSLVRIYMRQPRTIVWICTAKVNRKRAVISFLKSLGIFVYVFALFCFLTFECPQTSAGGQVV